MKLSVNMKIQKKIHLVRDMHVMLDQDLATLYGVETGALNRAVRRNRDRFPEDFMFQLDAAEFENLKCQIGISSFHGGSRHRPHVFTEQGVAMLSGVLKSKRAVQVNVEIMRTFVNMRRWALTYSQLTKKISQLESRYDGNFKLVFQTLKQLLNDNSKESKKIGFR